MCKNEYAGQALILAVTFSLMVAIGCTISTPLRSDFTISYPTIGDSIARINFARR